MFILLFYMLLTYLLKMLQSGSPHYLLNVATAFKQRPVKYSCPQPKPLEMGGLNYNAGSSIKNAIL